MKNYRQWRIFFGLLCGVLVCSLAILVLSGKVYVGTLQKRCWKLQKTFENIENQAAIRKWAEKEIFAGNLPFKHLIPVPSASSYPWPEEINPSEIVLLFDDLPVTIDLYDFVEGKPTCVCIRSGSRTGVIVSKNGRFDSAEKTYHIVAPEIAVFCLY